MIRHFLKEGLMASWLTVLSLDLLYLYWRGHWYDPTLWIEISEVFALIMIAFWGLTEFIKAIIRVNKNV